jgi:hypothetical protein
VELYQNLCFHVLLSLYFLDESSSNYHLAILPWSLSTVLLKQGPYILPLLFGYDPWTMVMINIGETLSLNFLGRKHQLIIKSFFLEFSWERSRNITRNSVLFYSSSRNSLVWPSWYLNPCFSSTNLRISFTENHLATHKTWWFLRG